MKKFLAALLILACLPLTLAGCKKEEEERIPPKAEGSVTREVGGISYTVPAFLEEYDASLDEDVGFLAAPPLDFLCYDPEGLQFRLYHLTASHLENILGVEPDISASDLAALVQQSFGLTDAYADQNEGAERLKPSEIAHYRMAYFDYGDSEDGEKYFYCFVALRETDGDGVWAFVGICEEEYRTTYTAAFKNWTQSASLPTRDTEGQ